MSFGVPPISVGCCGSEPPLTGAFSLLREAARTLCDWLQMASHLAVVQPLRNAIPLNQRASESPLSFLWTNTKGFDPHKEIYLVRLGFIGLPNMYCFLNAFGGTCSLRVSLMLTFLLNDPRQSVF